MNYTPSQNQIQVKISDYGATDFVLRLLIDEREAGTSPHGTSRLPLRTELFPLTEGLSFPHRGSDFPSPSKRPSLYGSAISPVPGSRVPCTRV